ncbi:hypothetical protein GCM10027418_21140 [Mariniluteicoccus endophyticus]
MPRLNDLLDAKLARDLFQRNFPKDRNKAGKLEKLATDDNVAAIVEALPRVTVDSYEFDDAAWSAVGVLVHAAAGSDADPAPALVLEELARRLAATDHGNRVLLWELLGFFPEVPAAVAAREVLDAEFQKISPGRTARWARELDLDVPWERRWSLGIVVKQVEDPQVEVFVDVQWTPTERENSRAELCMDWWSAGDSICLWYPSQPEKAVADYALTIARDGVTQSYAGMIDPPMAGVDDLPRVLAQIEEHNGITFDRAATKVSGSKGVQRAAKPIRDWLKAAAAPHTGKAAAQPKKPSVKSAAASVNKAPATESSRTVDRITDKKLAARLRAKQDVPRARKDLEKMVQLVADPASLAALVPALRGDRSDDFRDDAIDWVVGLLCQAVVDRVEGFDDAGLALSEVVTERVALGADRHQWRAWQPFSLYQDDPDIQSLSAPLAELVASTPSQVRDWAQQIGLSVPAGQWEVTVSWVGQGLLFLAAAEHNPGGEDGHAFWVSREGGDAHHNLGAFGATEVEIKAETGTTHTGTLPPAPTQWVDVPAYLKTVRETLGVQLDEEVRVGAAKGVRTAAKVQKWAKSVL